MRAEIWSGIFVGMSICTRTSQILAIQITQQAGLKLIHPKGRMSLRTQAERT